MVDALHHSIRLSNCGLFSVDSNTIMLVSILIRGFCMLVTTPDIHAGAHYGQKFDEPVLEPVLQKFSS